MQQQELIRIIIVQLAALQLMAAIQETVEEEQYARLLQTGIQTAPTAGLAQIQMKLASIILLARLMAVWVYMHAQDF